MNHARRIHELALIGQGLIHEPDACERGIPISALDAEVDRGRLQIVHPRVYRPTAVAPTWSSDLRAAVLAAGSGAVVSHRSAHRLHALAGRSGKEIELTVPALRHRRLTGVTVHRSTRLPWHHVQILDGLPVTTVDRTLADLGAVVVPQLVRDAVERAVIDRRTTIRRLYRLVDEHGGRGRRGIAALRLALDDWIMGERPPDSRLEVMFGRLVERFGLSVPSYQHELFDGDHFVARFDAAWPVIKLAVELDGLHTHATADALRRDLKRQNAVLALGWDLRRYPWDDVVRHPERIAAELRSLVL